ncbi:MAG: hypothetical protein M3Y32_13560, partial [Pseudomonadota bacterium]|nr:hypothetical protein [Pseudomonadota bacterium]
MIRHSPAIATQAPDAPATGARRGLLYDYNRAAAVYWWLVALAGALAFGWSVAELTTQPPHAVWQILGASAIAAVVGLFPLRIPTTKSSIAAGDVFIFLLLVLYG